jgi:ABC-type transport system substrate-binding protein
VRTVRNHTRLLIVVALSTLLALFGAACDGEDPTATPTPTSPPAPSGTTPDAPAPAPDPTATPVPEPTGPAVDRVVMAVASPTDFSNIRRIPGQASNWYIRPHYEYLVGFDKTNGAYVPQLAVEYGLEPDGHSWRFKLREGVQFHNGFGEVTAEDVRFSWLMNILPDDVGSEARTMRDIVKDVEIIGPYEVVFRTEAPNADVFEVVSEIQGGMEIASKADFLSRGPGLLASKESSEWANYEDDPRLAELVGGRDPLGDEVPLAGTGPYTIVSMDEQTGVVYERVEDHWRDTPDFPEFEFQFINEASTRHAKLVTGEVHLAKLPEELLVDAESRGFVTFTAQVPAARYFLAWQGVYVPAGPNLANDRHGEWSGELAQKEFPAYPNTPLANLNVRKALNKAIDRDELNDAFFAGKGLTMYKNHYLPDNAQRVGWNPEWVTRFDDEYGYDPDAARALLEQGLQELGIDQLQTTIQLTVQPAVPAGVDVMQAIANYWRDIGVDVIEQSVDSAEYRTKQREMRWDNHVVPIATSGAQLVTVHVYGSSLIPVLYIGLQDPDAEALMREALNTNTPQDRDDLLRTLGDMYYNLHQDIPLFYLPNEVVADPDVVADFIYSGMVSGAPIDHLEGAVAK